MTESLRGPDLSGLKIDDRARRGPTGRRWVLLSAGLVALLLVAGGLYAFLREAVAEVEVATVRADKGGRPTLLNASGYVTPRQRATIAAKITARVNEIFVDEAKRVEELWARRLVAEQALDQARMAVDSLKARIVLGGEQVAAAEARVRVA